MRDFFREGNHTWDIRVEYHQCPHCGYIVESREGYEKRLDQLQKDLTCRRCRKEFTVTQQKKSDFGPLWGKE